MKLNLSDIEANAVKHALEAYEKELSDGSSSSMKGTEYELSAVKDVIIRMDLVGHAPGM